MIQNTTIPQVRNLFSVIAVFISFPGALRAPTPPRPPFWGRDSIKKAKKKKIIVGVGEVAVAFCFSGGFGLLEGS
jgi:hypothetical protein